MGLLDGLFKKKNDELGLSKDFSSEMPLGGDIGFNDPLSSNSSGFNSSPSSGFGSSGGMGSPGASNGFGSSPGSGSSPSGPPGGAGSSPGFGERSPYPDFRSQSYPMQYSSPETAPSDPNYINNKNLEVISSKLDALKAAIDSMNQRLMNLERIAEGEQVNNRRRYF